MSVIKVRVVIFLSRSKNLILVRSFVLILTRNNGSELKNSAGWSGEWVWDGGLSQNYARGISMTVH